MTAFDVTLSDIEAARDRVAGRIRRTPAFESTEVSARLGRRTALKMEALQLAGSFKVRGVFNKVLTLERRRARARPRHRLGRQSRHRGRRGSPEPSASMRSC